MSVRMNKSMNVRASIRKNIREGILKKVQESINPISTLELCSHIGRAWHSVQNQCLQLQIEGKIEGFRVGNMNLWTKKKTPIKDEKTGKKEVLKL